MKYLVFDFKNAGIIKPDHFDNNAENYCRIDVPDGTLYVNHVYNMLSIMFGDRPLRTFKNNGGNVYNFSKIDKIYEMAKDAYVAIDSFQSYEDNKGKTHSVSEIVLETRFCPTKNSWRVVPFNIVLNENYKEIKSIVPSWHTLELFISNKNNFDDFCNHIKRITKIENTKSYSLISMIERLNVCKDLELLKFLKDNKYTNFVNLIYGKFEDVNSILPSWDCLKSIIPNENHYEIVCNHIKRITNIENYESCSVLKIVDIMVDRNDSALKKFLEENDYTDMINLIYKSKKVFTWHQIKWGHAPEYHRSFVTTSPMNMQRINGKIYVPIKDEEYTFDRLNIGTVFSTLLDGGMVELEEILDYWEPLNHNVNKVFCKES